jgi:Zn-dependent protease with chaperone function
MNEPSGTVEAAFFDGVTAKRHVVGIAPATDRLALMILREDGPPLRWPFDRLRALRDQSDKGRLTLTVVADTEDEAPRDAARLVIRDKAAIDWILRTRPGLMRRDLRPGTFRAVALWLSAAAAAVVVMLYVILPALADYLADHLPVESEVAFGKSVMKQIEWMVSEDDSVDLRCTTPNGFDALAKMKTRLIGTRDIGYDLSLTVLDNKMVNAFAAPGGQIVIFRGLLDDAASAEEVAAVLGHEIGHVAARDPTRLALRAAGSAGILSVVLGDITGGTLIAAAGDHLMQSAYTRDAEAAADDFALTLLNDARIDTAPMAGFFDRIANMTDQMPEYMSSHPLSADRARQARANAATHTNTEPILSAAEWQALKSICGGKVRPSPPTSE